jgi:hypothetical protein
LLQVSKLQVAAGQGRSRQQWVGQLQTCHLLSASVLSSEHGGEGTSQEGRANRALFAAWPLMIAPCRSPGYGNNYIVPQNNDNSETLA